MEIAPPYYVDGRLLLPPQFQWGSRIANPPPNLVYPNFVGVNRMDDVTISATKLVRSHTLKAGFFFQHSYKVQSLGQAAGAIPFTGLLNFANDTNNPIDTGFGYANAAAGIFSTYGQQSKLIEGVYVFDSIDWYLQDNWKVNSRLTLDYGLRFSHWQPQHDQGLQASNFFVDQWSSNQAPMLYQPGCPANVNPCAPAARQAVNSTTGALSAQARRGRSEPSCPAQATSPTGSFRPARGSQKRTRPSPGCSSIQRFGLAYDLFGDQRVVMRGSIGLFHDRPDGDAIFPAVGNPPTSAASSLRYSTLQSIGTATLTTAPPVLYIFQYDAKVPSATQWNVGVQAQLPWATVLDVTYAGNHGFNLLQNTQGRVGVLDINAVDFGRRTWRKARIQPRLLRRFRAGRRSRSTCCGPMTGTARSAHTCRSSTVRFIQSRPR